MVRFVRNMFKIGDYVFSIVSYFMETPNVVLNLFCLLGTYCMLPCLNLPQILCVTVFDFEITWFIYKCFKSIKFSGNLSELCENGDSTKGNICSHIVYSGRNVSSWYSQKVLVKFKNRQLHCKRLVVSAKKNVELYLLIKFQTVPMMMVRLFEYFTAVTNWFTDVTNGFYFCQYVCWRDHCFQGPMVIVVTLNNFLRESLYVWRYKVLLEIALH